MILGRRSRFQGLQFAKVARDQIAHARVARRRGLKIASFAHGENLNVASMKNLILNPRDLRAACESAREMAQRLRRQEREIVAMKGSICAASAREAALAADTHGLPDRVNELGQSDSLLCADALTQCVRQAEELGLDLEEAHEISWSAYCAATPFAAEKIANFFDEFARIRELARALAEDNADKLAALRSSNAPTAIT